MVIILPLTCNVIVSAGDSVESGAHYYNDISFYFVVAPQLWLITCQCLFVAHIA